MTDLEALIADLERGPSGKLDMRVGMACSPWPCEPFKRNPVMGRYGYSEIGPHFPTNIRNVIAPKYTSSLDAALMIVPEGYRSELQQSWDGTWWDAYVSPFDLDDTSPFETGKGVVNPALALCIAALKARAAIALAEDYGRAVMTLREFHNGLRLLLNIDMHELVAVGAIEADDYARWKEFRDNPHLFFIHASDAVADKLWALIQRGMPS